MQIKYYKMLETEFLHNIPISPATYIKNYFIQTFGSDYIINL